jgi:hypothetical protein
LLDRRRPHARQAKHPGAPPTCGLEGGLPGSCAVPSGSERGGGSRAEAQASSRCADGRIESPEQPLLRQRPRCSRISAEEPTLVARPPLLPPDCSAPARAEAPRLGALRPRRRARHRLVCRLHRDRRARVLDRGELRQATAPPLGSQQGVFLPLPPFGPPAAATSVLIVFPCAPSTLISRCLEFYY